MRPLRPLSLTVCLAAAMIAYALFATDDPARPKTEVTFNNWRFKLPHGWRMLEKDRSMVLSPTDLPAGKNTSVAIVLSPGTSLNADSKRFRSSFDTVLTQAHADLKVLSSEKTQSTTTDDGYEILTALYHVESSFGEKSTRFYLAAHPASRFEMLVFSSSSEDLFKKYQPALQDFISSAQFLNLPPNPNPTTKPTTQPTTKPAF